MTLFDLLFLLALLVTVITLITAAVSAFSGRRAKALKRLRVLGLCVIGYLVTGMTVSFLEPQRVIGVGRPWCFDDWCLTVENVSRLPAASEVMYTVNIRLSSRARGIAQRANGAWIYLIDDQGHRYAPEPDSSAVPLDFLLQPQESVTTSRVFRVPADARGLGLITGHGGPYCGPMDILIIGASGCVFHKPPLIRLP